jgi:hypothetical protein
MLPREQKTCTLNGFSDQQHELQKARTPWKSMTRGVFFKFVAKEHPAPTRNCFGGANWRARAKLLTASNASRAAL